MSFLVGFLFLPSGNLSTKNVTFLATIQSTKDDYAGVFEFGVTRYTLKSYWKDTSSMTFLFDFVLALLKVSTKHSAYMSDLKWYGEEVMFYHKCFTIKKKKFVRLKLRSIVRCHLV